MNRNRTILVGVGIGLLGFFLCGGLGLLLWNLTHRKDTGATAKPTTGLDAGSRPSEIAKATGPKVAPKVTVPLPPTGFVPKKGELPPEAELRKLVTQTMLDLDQAIKRQDFAAFHAKMASAWHRDKTPKDIQANYQNFINGKADFSPVKDVLPVFQPAPLLTPDGLLSLEGNIPAKNLRVEFKLQYVFEQNAWRLLNSNLNVSQTSVVPMGQ